MRFDDPGDLRRQEYVLLTLGVAHVDLNPALFVREVVRIVDVEARVVRVVFSFGTWGHFGVRQHDAVVRIGRRGRRLVAAAAINYLYHLWIRCLFKVAKKEVHIMYVYRTF